MNKYRIMLAKMVEKWGMLEKGGEGPTLEATHQAKYILIFMYVHQEELPVETILETLASLGSAPSLLYDDDGHWTIGGDGTQPVMALEDRTKETTFDATWWVGPNRWKLSIREAIRDYLHEQAHAP